MTRHIFRFALLLLLLGCHGQPATVRHPADAPAPKPPQQADIKPVETDEYSPYGVGGMPMFSKEQTEKLEMAFLRRKAFASGYSEERKLPLWTAYRVGADNGFRLKRPSKFNVDTETKSRVSKDAFDHAHTQLTRGHMAPNFAIMSHYGTTEAEARSAQVETFLMSNMCPQKQRLNGGLWSELENKSTQGNSAWGNEKTEVWILCGPVLDEKLERLKSGVAVPSGFFMILVRDPNNRCFDADKAEVSAFYFPADCCPKGGKLVDYATSVDEIEVKTGIDFFPHLEERLQNRLESETRKSLWKKAEWE